MRRLLVCPSNPGTCRFFALAFAVQVGTVHIPLYATIDRLGEAPIAKYNNDHAQDLGDTEAYHILAFRDSHTPQKCIILG